MKAIKVMKLNKRDMLLNEIKYCTVLTLPYSTSRKGTRTIKANASLTRRL